eukprot:CAMPEP_0183744528 /NCGR_PEP_ID=MMETSP0737-20130205/65775_1 /TAXON_ID=385413 /ORGANISM="Thalassiosira miniscula, Strain CCMP1093" /LENGTH=417 /DNA_ID=CAMNT_0025980169 /DNA_START=29 /DNA_END=1282 /DNA_ORIENTATION=+
MEFLGPRHACITIGATCQDLRQLSKSNSLWNVFWKARCLFPDVGDNDDDGDGVASVHKAAYMFRHAIHEMGLDDKLLHASHPQTKSATRQMAKIKKEGEQPQSKDESTSLYFAYIQRHTMTKLTNLRLHPFPRRLKNDDETPPPDLRPPLCSQTWPGQLSSLVASENLDDDNYHRNRVTCLNAAEAWCDHPGCDEARCGPQGCLRCYRFLPRDYGMSASGGGLWQARECSERSYDVTWFVKCSWCSVSFCNIHVRERYGTTSTTSWYKCDECQLSSCPDCVSQVFVSPPDVDGCQVVTAGKACRRPVCTKCIWYVGRETQIVVGNIPAGKACRRPVCTKCIWYVGRETQIVVGNIPGGDYACRGDSEIVTVKGAEVDNWKFREWEDLEKSCSKCLRHVEFRMKELAQVQDAFGGLMP